MLQIIPECKEFKNFARRFERMKAMESLFPQSKVIKKKSVYLKDYLQCKTQQGLELWSLKKETLLVIVCE